MLALILLSLVFVSQESGNQDPLFYDRILNDFSTSSTFIVVEVQSKEFRGRAVIENGDLFFFFHQTKGFNEKQYMTYAKNILSTNTRILLNDEDLSKWRFAKVEEVASVRAEALKGREKFIDNYFIRKAMKNEAEKSIERNAIIDQLFTWQIATRVDDESGYLMIQSISCQ